MSKLIIQKFLISGKQHCISYNVNNKIIYDSGLKYALSMKETTTKQKLQAIKILLGININETNYVISIREIKITNKKNFIEKKISTDHNNLF